jgi:hypothetical protein
MKGFLFPITTFIGLTASQAGKEELPLQLEKAFPTIMQTCMIPTDNGEILLSALYKSPSRTWIKLLSFRCKPTLAGDPNTKHPF